MVKLIIITYTIKFKMKITLKLIKTDIIEFIDKKIKKKKN